MGRHDREGSHRGGGGGAAQALAGLLGLGGGGAGALAAMASLAHSQIKALRLSLRLREQWHDRAAETATVAAVVVEQLLGSGSGGCICGCG